LSCAILQDTNWNQEAAEKGDEVTQNNLVLSYNNDEKNKKEFRRRKQFKIS